MTRLRARSTRRLGVPSEGLRSVGNGLAFCSVRDDGSFAKLSVFVKRPAETAIAQKIGFKPDREGVLFGHLDNMRPWRNVFQHAVWPSISN